jgi:hypothetical protein
MGSTPFPNPGQSPRFLKVLLSLDQFVSPILAALQKYSLFH